VVPSDVQLQYGRARISYYAEDGAVDGAGAEDRLRVGGIGNSIANDGSGPLIEAYLNNEQFVNGDVVNENPLLVVKLFDATGINISGTGIGHDITAVIDGNYRETIRLNPYYEAVNSGELQGMIRFLLPTLSEGKHTIEIKAWDVFNNSSTYTLTCRVEKQWGMLIASLTNYPNPFSGGTRFRFQLDGSLPGAQATIRVVALDGREIRSLTKTISGISERYIEMDWDGRDERGNSIPAGVYVYQLLVKEPGGQLSQKMRKLIIR
jgi:hypothetical protein